MLATDTHGWRGSPPRTDGLGPGGATSPALCTAGWRLRPGLCWRRWPPPSPGIPGHASTDLCTSSGKAGIGGQVWSGCHLHEVIESPRSHAVHSLCVKSGHHYRGVCMLCNGLHLVSS